MDRQLYLSQVTKHIINVLQDAIVSLRTLSGVETTEGQFDELCTTILTNQWTEQRIYHNPAHLYHMLLYIDNFYKKQGYFESNLYSEKDQSLLIIAICMHDYVYDYRNKKGQNEKASCNYVKTLLGKVLGSEFWIERIQDLIMLTVDHQNPKKIPMGDLLIDADLSILGESLERYQMYMAWNFAEYVYFYGEKADTEAFVKGRKAWIESFLARDSIFLMQEDTIARMNLMYELEDVVCNE
jgi:predicted metal-dependent HD superfamily phosphohydrolase